MISKEHLEAKLAELTAQRDKLAADINAFNGAIEILHDLIFHCSQSDDQNLHHPPEQPS